MPFRILSIDGGGLRGIIPIIILEHLLKITNKPTIADSFDLIAGTSTGGIIACGLSLKSNGTNVFNIEQIKEIYTTHGIDIFPKPSFFNWNLRSPKYGVSGLEKTLEKYFKQYTLQDCKTPILISAYDVNNYDTFYYSSRFVNPTSTGSMRNTQFKVADICRSTSAAPTYFPSHYFSYLNHQQTLTKCNLIDGGVFVNNPSLAALSEVLEHSTDPIYCKNQSKKIDLNDVYILSLGTGIGAKNISEEEGKKWGKLNWAPKLFDIMMQGNSQSVHNQLNVIMNKDNYLRLNVMLPEKTSELDDTKAETRDKLIQEVYRNIINNNVALNEINRFVANAGL